MFRALPAAAAFFLSACMTVGPPTLPLTPGAEVVQIRDADTIKSHPVDTTRCTALGQVSVGPIAIENQDVAIKNETFAKGGNFFFGTAYGGNLVMVTVSGTAYRCDPAPSSK